MEACSASAKDQDAKSSLRFQCLVPAGRAIDTDDLLSSQHAWLSMSKLVPEICWVRPHNIISAKHASDSHSGWTHIYAPHDPVSHVQHNRERQVIAGKEVLVQQSRHDLVYLETQSKYRRLVSPYKGVQQVAASRSREK